MQKKKIAVAVMGVFVAGAAFAAPDWSKVAPRTVTLFYPGQAGLEWVMNVTDHSAVPDITKKKRFCAKCHDGDANEIGDKMVAGKPVGSSKSVLEPAPVAGKVGSVPATVQIAHDDSKIYFRYEWESPKPTAGKKMDAKNEVKLTMMFDGGGTVDGAEIGGCWATCHTDLRTMKDAKDDKKTKYIKGADLASDKYMDLMQFRSGKGEKPVDGYVDTERHMDGGKSLLKAEGKKQGDKWVVVFERELAGKGKGDHNIVPGNVYNFGFAVHEDHAGARYHYVSLGYQFGLDKPEPDVKNYINVQKQ
ncbi:MAG: ethylbenzene dehydrogenase-related protein [Rhodocyclaceae bacterium]|nr:ethylbenzene dehydrogenase-related protein [Rhodocyclaceae bacterium]